MLERMEKLVNRHTGENILGEASPTSTPICLPTSKSTETALPHVTAHIELENSSGYTCSHVTYWGSFWRHHTHHRNRGCQTTRHGLGDAICRGSAPCWDTWKYQPHLYGTLWRGSVTRGCPQGGILSPLLWIFVLHELTQGLLRIAAIHCHTQLILLPWSAENSQTLSQSFFRRLWVWNSCTVAELIYLAITKDGDISIYKEEPFKGPTGTNCLRT